MDIYRIFSHTIPIYSTYPYHLSVMLQNTYVSYRVLLKPLVQGKKKPLIRKLVVFDLFVTNQLN
jgi:hypothetical protein